MQRIELLIDGRDVASDVTLPVRDPGRIAEVVGELAQATPAQVDQAVQAAARAFETWRKVPPRQRSALLIKAADMLLAEASSVVDLMARESGMLPAVNRAEIAMSANLVRDNAELAPDFLAARSYDDPQSWVGVEKEPIGVIAGIIPWNAPVILTMRKLAPALACGNTIVLKLAPTAAMGLSILLKRIATLFPPGVINVLNGNRLGHALATHPLVRKISFTGGGEVGRTIMREAAEGLKPVQFELGGNDPAIVLEDVNLGDAIPKLVASVFRRSGQFCFAVKRIYVAAPIYGRFVEAFLAETAKFRIGHPLAPGVTFGPMNNESQYKFIVGLTERARAAGARLVPLGEKLAPGAWHDGYYLQPVVVPDAAPDLEVVRVEQFGPIIPIVRVKDEAEAMALANDCELGLASSIWTPDAARAVALARRIEAGMTFINNHGTSRLGQRTVPFGGVKESGIGRESSVVGLAEYVTYHAINLHK